MCRASISASGWTRPPLPGHVDDVRVYRRALSTTELDQIRLTNKPIHAKLGLDLPFTTVH